MKGNLKSHLSCIPDMNTFDLMPEADYFILLTTDGLLQFLSISQIVYIYYYLDLIYNVKVS